MHHVINAAQFDRGSLEDLFERTDFFKEQHADLAGRREVKASHLGRQACVLFSEPSLRTRLSFESAAQRLGMDVFGSENAQEFSSFAKGESLEHAVQVINGYADVIVMRSPVLGSAAEAAAVSGIPVINGGDGTGEHPTQALLDLYTIKDLKGEVDNQRITMMGDLRNGRTVRSLSIMLTRFNNVTINYVSIPELQIGGDVLAVLDDHGVEHHQYTDMYEALASSDIYYCTRLQSERFDDKSDVPPVRFVVDAAFMDAAPDRLHVMHPMPINEEIDPRLVDPRLKFIHQAHNGVYVRTGLFDRVLSSD